MIHQPGTQLRDLAVRIATHVLPDMASAYGQADAGLISGLLMALAQDFERAAFNRMTDIEEIRQLFKVALDSSQNVPAKQAMEAFTEAAPASLHLRDLDQLHARGFELLIELHTWAETNDVQLNHAIWSLLRRHSERNKFEVGGP
ncbi:MAG: hypothetical protein V2I41_09330 [Pseudomonadales bacterium]|jgi:hypothetical protein|nr:hypothetical protein [Pseudomonadales bacterium]